MEACPWQNVQCRVTILVVTILIVAILVVTILIVTILVVTILIVAILVVTILIVAIVEQFSSSEFWLLQSRNNSHLHSFVPRNDWTILLITQLCHISDHHNSSHHNRVTFLIVTISSQSQCGNPVNNLVLTSSRQMLTHKSSELPSKHQQSRNFQKVWIGVLESFLLLARLWFWNLVNVQMISPRLLVR